MSRISHREQYGAGYAEGSDWTLLGCFHKVAKHADAPGVDDRTRLSRIRWEIALWRMELRERGLL